MSQRHVSYFSFLILSSLSISLVLMPAAEKPGIQGGQKAVKVTFVLSPYEVRYEYIGNKRIEKPVFGYNPSGDVIKALEGAGFQVIRDANQKHDLVLKISYEEKETQSPRGEFINTTTSVVAYFDLELQDLNGRTMLGLMGSHGQPEIPSEAKKFVRNELSKMIKGRLESPDEVTFLMSILKQGPSLGHPVKRELVWSNNPILRRLEELQDARTKGVFTSFLRSYSGAQRSTARSALLKLGYKPPKGTADEAAFEMVSAISGDRRLSEIIMSYGSPAIERIIEDLKCLYILPGQHWYGGGQISETHPDLVLTRLTENYMSRFIQRTAINDKGQYVREKTEKKQEWNDTAVNKLIEMIATEQDHHASFIEPNPFLGDKSLYDLAIEVLGEIADKRAIDPLKKYLAAHPGSVSAKEAIRKIGDPQAVEQIVANLKNSDPRVREIAASALGKIGDPRAVEPLISVLKDGSGSVRAFAARALGRMDDPRVIEPMMDAAKNDGDESVRLNAAEALGRTGDPRAVEPLMIAWMRSGPMNSENFGDILRGMMKKQGAEPFMAFLRSQDPKVRESTARVLDNLGWSPENDVQKILYLIARNKWLECVNIGKPAVEPLMIFISQGDGYARASAVEALAKIGDPRALESLLAALRDENRLVRQYAVDGLGKIGDSRAVEPLVAMLKDQDVYARMSAAAGLGKIRDSRVVEPLILALGDKEYRVQVSASKALREITGQDFDEQKKWLDWWKKNKKTFVPSRKTEENLFAVDVLMCPPDMAVA